MSSAPEEAVRPATTAVRPTRPKARAAALGGYVLVLAIWIRTFGIPNDVVQVTLWLWLLTICINIEAPPRYHLGFLRDWWAPIVGLVIYFFSRGLADEFGFTPHVLMPIEVDTWLVGGELPTRVLQEAWCGDPCLRDSAPRWYDVMFTTVYASHFLVGLSLAAVLWMRNRVEWKRWMRRFVGANFAALAIYIAYPMAPPWLASEEGYLSEPVSRITHRGWSDLGWERFDLILQGVGNPVAAMPSLHAGIAFLVAIYAIHRLRSPWRWVLIAYPVLMAVTLVYYGEHYIIDIVAGWALVLAVHAASLWWERIRGD